MYKIAFRNNFSFVNIRLHFLKKCLHLLPERQDTIHHDVKTHTLPFYEWLWVLMRSLTFGKSKSCMFPTISK